MTTATRKRTTIVVSDADPLQSLTSVYRRNAKGCAPAAECEPADEVKSAESVGAHLDAELDRIASLTERLAEQAAHTPPIEPIIGAPVVVARSSAREAWSAVVLLVLFIVAGFAWTSTRITAADTQVATLTRQLEEKQTAIVSYQQQIKTLRRQLAEAEAKLKEQAAQQAPLAPAW